MPAQSAADLRSLVARLAGPKRRVALLSADAGLVSLLEANGCSVLVDPPTREALAEFRPDTVVAFDALLGAEGAFAMVGDAVPDAELLFSFANSASASALVGALAGQPVRSGASEREVVAALGRAGYAVMSREAVVMPHQPSGLSADTEAALRALFEQLNPAAGVDRLLLVARRGVEAAPPERVAGLLSAVVSAPAGSLLALEGTLASLANQPRRPLEVVVAADLPEAELRQALAPLKSRPELTVDSVTVASADFATRTNQGLEQAHGQYVAFFEAGDLVGPAHLSSLVGRLESGTQAWAVGRVRVEGREDDGKPPASAFDLLRAGAVERCGYVIDRSRLGLFPLSFAAGVDAPQALLFARLTAVFEPVVVWGEPGVDRTARPAERIDAVLEALKGRPLRALSTVSQLVREPPKAELSEVLAEAVDARSPAAGRALRNVEAVLRKVARAATDAQSSARQELDQARRRGK